MELLNKPVSKTGFSCVKGFNYHQILSWVYCVLDTVLCYYLIQESLPFLVWESLVVLVVLYNCLQATRCDPTDPCIYEEHKVLESGRKYETSLTSYCLVCRAHVQNKSKHCGQCNRCTSKFDHHCVWLNNCIGESNYRHFLQLVISLVILKATKITVSVLCLFSNDPLKEGLSIFSLVVDPFVLIMLCYLLMMHVYFIYHKISTYDWIKIRRERLQKQMDTEKVKQQAATLNDQVKLDNVFKSSKASSLGTSLKSINVLLSPRQNESVQNSNPVSPKKQLHKQKTSGTNQQVDIPAPPNIKVIFQSPNLVKSFNSIVEEKSSMKPSSNQNFDVPSLHDQSFHAHVPPRIMQDQNSTRPVKLISSFLKIMTLNDDDVQENQIIKNEFKFKSKSFDERYIKERGEYVVEMDQLKCDRDLGDIQMTFQNGQHSKENR